MKKLPLPAALLAASLSLSVAPAALAETAPPVAPAPPTTPAPPAAPAPPVPVAGALKLSTPKVGGTPAFALAGGRLVVHGLVTPYVSGQTLSVGFFRDGKQYGSKTVTILPTGKGTGTFALSFPSGKPGLVEARATHAASTLQAAFAARTKAVRFVTANLAPGSSGPSVRLLQSELSGMHFAVPLSGVFDEGTGRALIAYRKMTGQERIAYAGRKVFHLLERHAGAFHVRYPHDGRHVEGDLTKQVLAEIEPGGKVRRLYTMSSGKPSTPTVIGRFNVYMRTPGVNSEGMVDSSYFIRGYAIHGYAEVPTYAASHGCLRVPVPDALSIYDWVRQGMPVDVYNEDGAGSSRVRSDAGP